MTKKMAHRALSFFLALVMCLSLLPAVEPQAQAAIPQWSSCADGNHEWSAGFVWGDQTYDQDAWRLQYCTRCGETVQEKKEHTAQPATFVIAFRQGNRGDYELYDTGATQVSGSMMRYLPVSMNGGPILLVDGADATAVAEAEAAAG